MIEIKAPLESLEDKLSRMPEVTPRQLEEVNQLEKDYEKEGLALEELKRRIKDITEELRSNGQELDNGINQMITNINDSFRE